MTFPPDRSRRAVRHIAAGVSLLLMPLLGVASTIVLPSFTGGMSGELAFIAARPARWLLGMAFDLGATFLLIPVALTIAHLVRRRAPLLGLVGAALVVTGAFVHSAVLGYQLAEAPLVARAGAGLAALTPTVEAMYVHRAFNMIVFPFLFTFFPGLLVLAAALWRAHAAPRAVPVLMVLAVAAEVFAPVSVNARLLFGLLLLAFGTLGTQVLRMSRDAWEAG